MGVPPCEAFTYVREVFLSNYPWHFMMQSGRSMSDDGISPRVTPPTDMMPNAAQTPMHSRSRRLHHGLLRGDDLEVLAILPDLRRLLAIV